MKKRRTPYAMVEAPDGYNPKGFFMAKKLVDNCFNCYYIQITNNGGYTCNYYDHRTLAKQYGVRHNFQVRLKQGKNWIRIPEWCTFDPPPIITANEILNG